MDGAWGPAWGTVTRHDLKLASDHDELSVSYQYLFNDMINPEKDSLRAGCF